MRPIAALFALVALACGEDTRHVRDLAPVQEADAAPDPALPEDAGSVDSPRDAGRPAPPDDAAPTPAPADAGSDASVPSDEPALSTDENVLIHALHCPAVRQARFDPVLLVHGTGANAEISWSWTYVPALTALGYDVCTIDLPGSSWDDIPTAAEYVVLAVRAMLARTNRSLVLIGHSQGTLEIRWALSYWPSLRPRIARVIGLAGVDHGAAQAGTTCAVGFCRVATWQMRPGSHLLAVLGGAAPTGVRYTSIYSTTDDTAVAPTSVVDGAFSIALQELCPGRTVGHAAMVSDAVTYALVRASLEGDDEAAARARGQAACALDRLDSIAASVASDQEGRGSTYFLETYLGGPTPGEEPPLPPYAERDGGAP